MCKDPFFIAKATKDFARFLKSLRLFKNREEKKVFRLWRKTQNIHFAHKVLAVIIKRLP
jgi:hypothetical protein